MYEGKYVVWRKTILGETKYGSNYWRHSNECDFLSNALKFNSREEAEGYIRDYFKPKEQRKWSTRKIV